MAYFNAVRAGLKRTPDYERLSMAEKIFINYRRVDDPGTTGRLFDRLEQEFGRDSLFMDVEGSIKAGDDYVEVLRSQIAACDLLLVIIGPRWLSVVDEVGRRRIDNPEDWVRIEISAALAAGNSKRVIPVLVGPAEMPRVEDLPLELQGLARKQAVKVTLERFKSDVQGLLSQIKSVLEDLSSAKSTATDLEKAAAAAAELERLRAVEERVRSEVTEKIESERARLRATSTMTLEQLRRAEELASWDFVKDLSNEAEVRNHIARFVGGATEQYALAKLESLVWSRLKPNATTEALQRFLEEFPDGAYAVETAARISLQANQDESQRAETAEWTTIEDSGNPLDFLRFVEKWPKGQFKRLAASKINQLTELKIKALESKRNDPRNFGIYRRQESEWKKLKLGNDLYKIAQFVGQLPDGVFADLARLRLIEIKSGTANEISPEKNEARIYCSACGDVLDQRARFCQSCGSPIQPTTATLRSSSAQSIPKSLSDASMPVAPNLHPTKKEKSLPLDGNPVGAHYFKNLFSSWRRRR